MISIRIPKEIECIQLLSTIRRLINSGVQSFEFNVKNMNNKLIICTNLRLIQNKECPKKHIQLEELFEWIIRGDFNIQIILNLQEPNLESLVRSKVEKWELKKKVIYTGNVLPLSLTLWDRLNIHYDVENCLPNFYELGTIKKAHFDVIHYFCRKYKVKTLRLKQVKLSQDLLCWAADHDLKIAIYDVDSRETAEALYTQGVDFVTTTDLSIYEKKQLNEM